jgi:hypothetical protein
VAFFRAAHGGINIYGRLQRLDSLRLLVDALDESRLSRFLERNLGIGLLDRPGPEQTTHGGQQRNKQYRGPKGLATSHEVLDNSLNI